MPPSVFVPAVPPSERRQTYALNRAANGIGIIGLYGNKIIEMELREIVFVWIRLASTESGWGSVAGP